MNISLIYVDEDLQAFGLRSISAYLKKSGYSTKLILMNSTDRYYSKNVLEKTMKLVAGSDIIGISCFSRASRKAKQILEFLRHTGKLCTWGGVHATLNPEDCVNYADVICRGEGEGFMADLVKNVERGDDWRHIPNAVYRDNGRIVGNDLRPLIENLDEIPVMDFSYNNEFHLQENRFVRVHENSDASFPIAYNGTRGCAFHCTYCSNSKLKSMATGKGRFVRKLSIPSLMHHLEYLRSQFPFSKSFNFFDEDFCARKETEIEQFKDAYLEKINMPFECMISPMLLNEKKMGLLVEAGVWRINMGIESGSDRTKREIYRRPMNNKAVMKAAYLINEHPYVIPYYFFIIGNPFEEKKDMLETIQLILDLPCPFFLRVYNLVFFPGTILYEMAVHSGIIRGAEDSGYELDFLGGFRHEQHAWKSKNLYLNGLIYLTAGKITRKRLGLIPRSWIKFLIRPAVVDFNEKHTAIIIILINIKSIILRFRTTVAAYIKKALKDPASIYNLKGYFKSKFTQKKSQ